MNYRDLWPRLTATYDESEAKAIVRWVLEVGFGLTMTDIYSGRLEQLTAADQDRLEQTMRRLEQVEPAQYVLGLADFCDRQFHVTPDVLIPRPETEELCRWILKNEERAVRHARGDALDIGTGSGCIAITLALDMPWCEVTAWDISNEALDVARGNAKRLGAHVSFCTQDALNIPPSVSSSTKEKWGLIVSNPPYICEKERDEMGENVLKYEPHKALFAPTDDPAVFYRRIGDYAIHSLRHGGHLYFELNPLTAEGVAAYLRRLGFSEIELRADQFGKTRFLKAKKI